MPNPIPGIIDGRGPVIGQMNQSFPIGLNHAGQGVMLNAVFHFLPRQTKAINERPCLFADY